MKNQYLDTLTILISQTHPDLVGANRFTFKSVFGAVAGYVDGHIFISSGKFGLALRLPADTLASLFGEADVTQLKYFPKGHIKKEYAVLPRRIVENTARIHELIDESVQYASASPGQRTQP